MLQLTKRTEYGLIALVHMVDRENEFVSAREISERYQIPRRLLAEVLKELARMALVDSQRGATGGYALARPAESIALGEVLSALEGAPTLASCEGFGAADRRGECGVEPFCPIRSPLHRLREGIWRQLERTTLRALARPSFALTAVEEPFDAQALVGAGRTQRGRPSRSRPAAPSTPPDGSMIPDGAPLIPIGSEARSLPER